MRVGKANITFKFGSKRDIECFSTFMIDLILSGCYYIKDDVRYDTKYFTLDLLGYRIVHVRYVRRAI